MTGWQAARSLKGNAATKATPILAVTAKDTSGDYDESYEAGCDAYLAKPVEPARLIERINELLP